MSPERWSEVQPLLSAVICAALRARGIDPDDVVGVDYVHEMNREPELRNIRLRPKETRSWTEARRF